MFTSFRPTSEVKLERREIYPVIRSVASELTRKRWYEVRQTGETKAWSQLYLGVFNDIPVELDANTGDNFSFLPVPEEDTPNSDGIQSIIPVVKNAEKRIPLIPIPINAQVVISQLPVGVMEGRFSYTAARNKVIYTKNRGRTLLQEKINFVDITMITPLADETEDVNSPIAISNDLLPELLRLTLATFGIEKEIGEEELVNDNA